MSKIGKKLIQIPQGSEIVWDKNSVTVKGPKGELTKKLALSGFVLSLKEGVFQVVPASPARLDKKSRAMWGTLSSIINSMVLGVNTPFEKILEFQGIGYRAEVSGNQLKLHLGFSHPLEIEIPAGLAVSTAKNQITISGVDKESAGSFAAKIRKLRPVEPYKGRGIRYQGERVRRKAGKKLAGAAGA